MCRNAHPKTTQSLLTAEASHNQAQANLNQVGRLLLNIGSLCRAFQTGSRKISKNTGMQGDDLGRRALSLFSYRSWLLRSCLPNVSNGKLPKKLRGREAQRREAQRGAEGKEKVQRRPGQRPRQAQRSPERHREAQRGQRGPERPGLEKVREAQTGQKGPERCTEIYFIAMFLSLRDQSPTSCLFVLAEPA